MVSKIQNGVWLFFKNFSEIDPFFAVPKLPNLLAFISFMFTKYICITTELTTEFKFWPIKGSRVRTLMEFFSAKSLKTKEEKNNTTRRGRRVKTKNEPKREKPRAEVSNYYIYKNKKIKQISRYLAGCGCAWCFIIIIIIIMRIVCFFLRTRAQNS